MRSGADHVVDIIPLALAAAVYPPLLAGIIILLARDKPVAMLAAFMAGGMVVSLVLGLLIVFVLGDWLSSRSQNSTSPMGRHRHRCPVTGGRVRAAPAHP